MNPYCKVLLSANPCSHCLHHHHHHHIHQITITWVMITCTCPLQSSHLQEHAPHSHSSFGLPFIFMNNTWLLAFYLSVLPFPRFSYSVILNCWPAIAVEPAIQTSFNTQLRTLELTLVLHTCLLSNLTIFFTESLNKPFLFIHLPAVSGLIWDWRPDHKSCSCRNSQLSVSW